MGRLVDILLIDLNSLRGMRIVSGNLNGMILKYDEK